MKYFRVGNLTITNQLLNPYSFSLLNGKTQFTKETHGVIVALFTKILCFQKKDGKIVKYTSQCCIQVFQENRLLVSHEITHETDTEGERKKS